MRAKSVILLILALGCGLVASIGINQVLANRGQTIVKHGETQPICVAVADVEMFDPVVATVVKLEQWPKDKVPAGAIANLADAEGRRAKTKIFAGEPLLDGKLLPKGETGAGASQLVPKGFRTVGVKVDMDSGLAGLIKPGDRVDVLVFVQANRQMNVLETATYTVLQNVKVFAVDSTFRSEDSGAAEEAIQARTVSLVVTPEQAETVLLAAQLGKVQLSLRNANDDEVANSQGTNTRAMLGGSDDSPPADLPDFLKGQEPKIEEPKPAEPADQVAEAPLPPQWKMTIIKGADAVQYEFREGQLPQIIAALGGASNAKDRSPSTGGGILSLPGFNPPAAGAETDEPNSTDGAADAATDESSTEEATTEN